MKALVAKGMKLDNIVLNAGMLKYPNVSGEPLGESFGLLARADGVSRERQKCTNLCESNIPLTMDDRI